MPAERFYVDDELNEGSRASIEGAELHHLAHVMRVGVGEKIELVNGKGALGIANVVSIDKKKAIVELLECEKGVVGPSRFILGIPFMRLSKLEWVIEKGTELGADEFWIYTADHSEKDTLSPNQTERLRYIAISAMKQSGRLDLPSFRILAHLEELFHFSGTLLFGDINPSAPFIWEIKDRSFPILFVSGPEKGFSNDESKSLKIKAKGVRISKNILRSETAPISAMAILYSLC